MRHGLHHLHRDSPEPPRRPGPPSAWKDALDVLLVGLWIVVLLAVIVWGSGVIAVGALGQ